MGHWLLTPARRLLVVAVALCLLSACATISTSRPFPLPRGIGVHRPKIKQVVTRGEYADVTDSFGRPSVTADGSARSRVNWDPTFAQIAASAGVGAVWFFFAVAKPAVDDLTNWTGGREKP